MKGIGLKTAIIGGSGKMGKWFARFLSQDGKEVIIAGRNQSRLLAVQRELGVQVASIEEAVKTADVVLLSVTIDSFEEVVRRISSFVRPDQLVVDITSVKQMPVDIMHKYLKGTVLGTHPVFGPGARDLVSQNFVLTPTNEAENELAQKAKEYLEAKGARVSIMTPREHDEMMAVVLGLAHFISIVSADTLAGVGKLPQLKAIGGSTYRVLVTLVESVISEDPELYATLQMNLPHVPELEALFQKNAAEWASMVKGKKRQEFVRRMAEVRNRFEKGDPAFGRAYENMYKIMEWL